MGCRGVRQIARWCMSMRCTYGTCMALLLRAHAHAPLCMLHAHMPYIGHMHGAIRSAVMHAPLGSLLMALLKCHMDGGGGCSHEWRIPCTQLRRDNGVVSPLRGSSCHPPQRWHPRRTAPLPLPLAPPP